MIETQFLFIAIIVGMRTECYRCSRAGPKIYHSGQLCGQVSITMSPVTYDVCVFVVVHSVHNDFDVLATTSVKGLSKADFFIIDSFVKAVAVRIV